jgi:hypothetical protein
MAAELQWKRSSRSNNADSSCVECAGDGRVVWIRDSKDPHARRLRVPMAGWRAFVALVRN